jgi:hypothetical protein
MANTPVYTRGVKYIKVARIDASGKDNTTQLQNLTDIREVFSDINNPVQYDIIGINEYPTYYLYSIVPTDVTSSVDQEILNYKVSGSSTSINNVSSTYPAVGGWVGLVNNFTIQGGTNTLNYFTASSGYWTFGNTPNIAINITCSIDYSVTSIGGVGMELDLYSINSLSTSPNSPILSTGSGVITTGTYNLTLTGSFTPIEGETYVWIFRNIANSTVPNSTSVQFLSTQSLAVQSSVNDITVLEPYIDEIFDGSDCDVLQNNADLNRFDSFFMEMDFTSGSILPQNQQAILNGSATRAQVQPWNYTYTSQVRSRYAGRQQNAIAVNVYTSASQFQTASSYGFSGSWPGDTTSPSLNGSIVVQQLDSCIYTTNWAGGGYPENSYGGIFSLNDILLIGENKDAVQVLKSDSPLYYQILNQNLPFSSSFIQRAYNPNNALSSQLTSLYPGVQLQDAAYWIPSNFNLTSLSPGATGGTFYPTGSPTYIGTPYLQLSSSAIIGIPTGIRNAANIQQTGSIALIMDPILEIMNKVASGSKWYMSFYSSSLGNIADGTDFNQYGYPFEITKVIPAVPSDKYDFLLKADASAYFPISNLPYSVYHVGYSGSQNNLGLLFTPGTPNQNQLVAYGDQWRDWSSDSGYLTLQYPKQVVTQNANYITKTYGNNPNP